MPKTFYPIKLYLKSWPNLITLTLSLLINIFVWIWLLWNIKPQTEMIFLHYNILFGVDYVGVWWKVIYLAIGGLAVLIINSTLGWWLFDRDKFFSHVLNAVALFYQIFLLIAAWLLIFLNV